MRSQLSDVSIKVCTGAALWMAALGGVSSADDITKAWASSSQRPTPRFQEAINYSCKYAGDHESDCDASSWYVYLKGRGLGLLNADRAYRVIWDGGPSRGFIQLDIDSSGSSRISSSLNPNPYHVDFLKKDDYLPFEKALMSSPFPQMQDEDGNSCVDDCRYVLIEAKVGSRYHAIVRTELSMNERVSDAVVLLERLAGFDKHLSGAECIFACPEALH